MPSGREAPCKSKPLSSRCTTIPSALSTACQIGRKKLIFSSTVVRHSSGVRVLANAIPWRRRQCRKESRRAMSPWDWRAVVRLPTRPLSPSVRNVFCLKSDQTPHGHVARLHPLAEIGLHPNFSSTHDLSAPAFDFRDRTLVSRYSSRWRQARSRGSSLRCRRLTIKLPSRVLAISVANFAESTSGRTWRRPCPSSTIDRRRSSHELRACRAFARN
jgi:hypothetical protein